ncbi:MAG: hypothetical protein M0Q44_01340 [Methylobacter sp.]|jgi:hypothetical protein|nr:hypothetical protein [Methylobacter sp.]
MLNNVPDAINKLARNVVINHPNSFNCTGVRKRVTRAGPIVSGLPTLGGLGVMSNDDEEDIDWDLLGNGYALKAESFSPSMMMDRQDANNGFADEFKFLIEPEVLQGNGSGAAFTFVVTAGVVTSAVIVSGGTGYMTGQKLVFVGVGTGAVAAIVATDGVITSVALSAGGTGYAVAPTATVDDYGFTVKKHDVIYLIIGDTRQAFEIVGVETTSDIPPYTKRYVCNIRDDLHFAV